MQNPIVLIADANHRIRQFLNREFRAEGFTVVHAGTCEEIFSRLDAPPLPDLIVIDPDMPYMGEDSLMGKILARIPRIPVVVYSPYPEYEDHPVFRNADAFVEKIANPALLIRTVHLLLSRKARLADNPSFNSYDHQGDRLK